jgi:hypothetical protein
VQIENVGDGNANGLVTWDIAHEFIITYEFIVHTFTAVSLAL